MKATMVQWRTWHPCVRVVFDEVSVIAKCAVRLVGLTVVVLSLAVPSGTSHAQSPDAPGEPPAPTAESAVTADSDHSANGADRGASDAVSERPAGAAADHGKLANAAANPAAPLTQIQIRNIFAPDASGADGPANLLQLQPVIPIGPFDWFRALQIVRVTFPLVTLPDPVDESGFGDIQVFDLVSFETSWGRLGVGPYLVFPTAASDDLGAGKYQAGPAVAAIYARGRLTAGAILQNPISFAGDPDRPEVNQLIVAPTLTITFGQGWFAGLSDFNWTFDWENHGAALIPVGAQVGKIVTLGRQPFTLALEVGRTAARPSGTPNPGWILGIEINPLFNWHLGPKQKIRLRGKSSG
jgi:hypothetical protein